jgi:hypothetical protein
LSKESREIKVTDKRMFNADGKLRDEYSFLEETPEAADAGAAAAGSPAGAGASVGTQAPPAAEPAGREPTRREPDRRASPEPAWREPDRSRAPAGQRGEPSRGETGRREPAGAAASDYGNRIEIPGAPPGLGPTFYDLVAMLAEPVSIYLGDLELPDGETAENLEMARLHIDLLDVLRQKTAGNLSPQESAFLEDLLYRLRVRYVQKRG